MNKFAGKTAIISGGAEGIGFSIAKALGKEGMNIVLTDIDIETLESARKELDREGIPVLGVALDVAEESQWQTVAEKAVDRFGKVHMVVNNAGIGGDPGPIEKQNEKTWMWTLHVNLMGVVYGAKTIVPLIKDHGEGGWVVNVASMAGMGGIPYSGAYTATKSAVVALSESWAAELRDDGVAVSVLCPAFVQTRIYDSNRNKQTAFQSTDSKPIGADPREEMVKQMVDKGMDVSIVGKRVVEALKAGELYIFTHPNYRDAIKHRAAAIDAAFERAAKSPLLQHIVDQKIDVL